jgi:hypothetical protein
MSQANLQISASTDTGTTLSDKLNAWREAVYSMQRGATRPSYAIAGFQWLDEVSATQWDWYFFDGTQDIKVAQIDPVTHSFILVADQFYIEDLFAKDIDGLKFRSQNGTLIATLGAGNSTDVAFVGSVSASSFVGNLTGSATILQTTNYSIKEEGGKLSFYYGATKIASMDSTGNLNQVANVTAYGTP